jgi:hypothetical protein
MSRITALPVTHKEVYMTEPGIILKFTPANPGDFLQGVPQRDLTAEDVARLEPPQLRNLTAIGPSGKPIYSPPKAEKPTPDVKGDK